MEEHEKGREAFGSDDDYRLHALRHSTAHVMAEAIGVVFEGAKFTVGPPIKDGFFYDVDVDRPIAEEGRPNEGDQVDMQCLGVIGDAVDNCEMSVKSDSRAGRLFECVSQITRQPVEDMFEDFRNDGPKTS